MSKKKGAYSLVKQYPKLVTTETQLHIKRLDKKRDNAKVGPTAKDKSGWRSLVKQEQTK